ncbi:hypothetical protein NQ176_g7050 [Zarea fungicola]|uniref:Uncharacterized protein n=1 Tax=Zarea fungicola TaxID=93591 RepID=A0ACC1N0K4_9HYPO|nr:hypothetical protein NQ176_g7050 [Lecanicillium fungicola]
MSSSTRFRRGRVLGAAGFYIVNTVGMVVCDSPLNGIKTLLYNLHQPIGDARWNTNAAGATPQKLQHGLAYIQAVMAVFDYYDDPNVKSRHRDAYIAVRNELALFERSYRDKFTRDIFGQWQERWKDYMEAHMQRVVAHARGWALAKLRPLQGVWDERLINCYALGDPDACAYDMLAVVLIQSYISAIDQGQKITFDYSIFSFLA